MPRMLPVRRRWSHTLPRTNSAQPLTRSRPHARLPLKARARMQADSNAVGSATSYRMPFESLSWTISGCETISAGRYSTADGRLVCASTAQQVLQADITSGYAEFKSGSYAPDNHLN